MGDPAVVFSSFWVGTVRRMTADLSTRAKRKTFILRCYEDQFLTREQTDALIEEFDLKDA